MPTNKAFAHGEPWAEADVQRFGTKFEESTFAEPFGILMALHHTRCLFPDATRFAITNDNTVAVVSHSKGFNSRSWHINEALRARDEWFPTSKYEIVLRHVAGVTNIADGPSRGGPVGEAEGDKVEVLRSRWGVTGAATEGSSPAEPPP